MMDARYDRKSDRWDGADADALRYEVARMGGLRKYPNEVAAVRELILVLAACENQRHVDSVMVAILESAVECPTAAQLRAVVDSKRPKRAKCRDCDGNGYTTVPVLITYHGNSLKVLSQQRLEGLIMDAMEWAATLPANQTVTTAAAPCHCLPMNHLSYTEGR
jgi:hypothetical protein